MQIFKEYLKTNFAHKKIIQLKQGDKAVDISIFPNGKLYDMSGESIDYDNIDKIWNILYISAKQGKLNIFDEEPK